MKPGLQTSEFLLTVLLLAVAAAISLVQSVEEARAWLEAAWPPVAAYAGARAVTKAAART